MTQVTTLTAVGEATAASAFVTRADQGADCPVRDCLSPEPAGRPDFQVPIVDTPVSGVVSAIAGMVADLGSDVSGVVTRVGIGVGGHVDPTRQQVRCVFETTAWESFANHAFGQAAECELITRPLPDYTWARGAAAVAIQQLFLSSRQRPLSPAAPRLVTGCHRPPGLTPSIEGVRTLCTV